MPEIAGVLLPLEFVFAFKIKNLFKSADNQVDRFDLPFIGDGVEFKAQRLHFIFQLPDTFLQQVFQPLQRVTRRLLLFRWRLCFRHHLFRNRAELPPQRLCLQRKHDARHTRRRRNILHLLPARLIANAKSGPVSLARRFFVSHVCFPFLSPLRGAREGEDPIVDCLENYPIHSAVSSTIFADQDLFYSALFFLSFSLAPKA